MANSPSKTNLHLTSGRLLARNTVWNLAGNGAPLIVAVFSIPILIRGLGKDRFGVLTLAWALIGYASLFDIGLGRALTQVVAKKLGVGEEREVPMIVWTSLMLMLALGVLGALVIAAISPWLVHRLLKIPETLQLETLRSFYLLAVSIPMVIIAAGLRGLLEAHQRFDLVTYLRIPLGVFTFAGPLLVLPFSRRLTPVVAILVVGRFGGCIASYWQCLRVAPELHRGIAWHMPSAVSLLRFGGWMTIGNIVGPLMMYMDRFVVGALVSATAVAYYATPFEIVTKFLILSSAISTVMFPAFSLSGVAAPSRSSLLYRRALRYMVIVMLPTTVVLVVVAKQGLSFWLGAEFGVQSYRVAQLILVGTCALAIESVPFVLIQGLGRPHIPALLNLAEIPFYALGLYVLVLKFGIIGAALAWASRAVVDAFLLICFAQRLQDRQCLSTKMAQPRSISLRTADS